MNFFLENNIILNFVLNIIFKLSEKHDSKTHTRTGKIMHYLSAVFWTGNRKITYTEQQQVTCYNFTFLMVTFKYYPVFVTGGFRRFNELRNRNPNFKTLVAIGGWNEGSVRYSQVSHFQCLYMWIMFSSLYGGKVKSHVLPVNIHKCIGEQIMLYCLKEHIYPT